MTIARRYARRCDDGRSVAVVWEGTRLVAVEPVALLPEHAADVWVGPAFCDIQTNGFGGREYASPDLTTEDVARIADRYAVDGVGWFLPTVTTQSFETLSHGLRTIAAACREDARLAARMPGIHLEGPYISPQDGARGAHPPEHVRPPDWEEFSRLQAAADGRIRLVTLSPEHPAATDFIRRAAATGVVISIGHTAADGEQIRAAVDAGASLSTHLGNGTHRQLPRHPNYIWDQLADDRLIPSLIADGFHLPVEVLKVFLRVKGTGRCILISDYSGHAGRPPGRYPSMGGEVEILPDGRLVVAGQRQLLAGAGFSIGRGIALVHERLNVPLGEAVGMASRVPNLLFGRPTMEFRPGDPADFAFFRRVSDPALGGPTLSVAELVFGGETLHRDGSIVS